MIRRVSMAQLQTDVSESRLLGYSRWAVALTAGAMFTYVWRFKVGPVPTNVLEILVLATMALYVVGRLKSGSWRPHRTGLEIPTALLLIAGAVAIAVSPNHIGALGFYRAYFVEPVILFYVAIDLLRAPRHFRIVLLGLAAGSTLFAILNLGAWAIALLSHQPIATANAPEALYTSPNSVAIFLEAPFAIAAGYVLYSDDRRERWFAAACLVFLLAALLLTLSRAAWLTLALLTLVAVVTMPNLRVKLAILGGALIGGFAVVQIPYVHQRLARQLDFSFKENTFEGRVQIWSDTLRMLRDRPIFGTGLRGYERVMTPYMTGTRLPELYPHNLFLAMWAELGLLGLVAFAVLLAMLLWRGWRGFYRAHGFARPLLWGTSAAFVAVAVHGMFDTPYYNNDISLEFWIVAALEIAALRTMAANATRNPDFVR
jgi:putative inorganic carbon (HCO3(-)) transporter